MNQDRAPAEDILFPPELPADATETFHSRRRNSDSSSAVLQSNDLHLVHWNFEDQEPISPEEAERSLAEQQRQLERIAASPSAFELKKPFARGGSGEIWEAVQNSLGRIVAVKRLRRQTVSDDAPIEDSKKKVLAFKQEALTTANLEHPNIVPIYDLGLDDEGYPLLAMKMIRGDHWNYTIQKDFDRMMPQDFLSKHIPILISISQAVAFAHSRGIVHRDIKASQVMVGEFGEVLLTDWGLAVVFDQERLRGAPLGELAIKFTPSTRSAVSPAGTPACMAPEQTLPTADRVGPWTDIFLLGATLYVLLTGEMPFEAPTSKEAFRKAMLGEVMAPEKRGGPRESPRELCDLAMRCLQPDPGNRPKDVSEFVHVLQEYISGAGKRRESRQITERLSEQIGSLEEDYKGFSEVHEQLSRAMTLWPENPKLRRLKEHFYSEYARSAMKNNDLTLAEIQAENIPSKTLRGVILNEIKEHQTKQRRHAKERRQLVVGFLVLLVVFLGVVYLIFHLNATYAENQARRFADQEQATVVRGRAEAQKKIADSYRDLIGLKSRQAALVEELTRLIPLPQDLNWTPSNLTRVEIAELETLIAEASMLTERIRQVRGELPEEEQEFVAEPPAIIQHAGIVSQLHRAQSERELRRLAMELSEMNSSQPSRETLLLQAAALQQAGEEEQAKKLQEEAEKAANSPQK